MKIKNIKVKQHHARRVILAAMATATVLGAGTFMQGQHASAMVASAPPGDLPDQTPMPSEEIVAAAAPAEIVPTNVTRVIATSDQPVDVAGDCKPTLAAKAGSAALVHLSVLAPCGAFESFIVHHEGMMFSARTDGDGAAQLLVPAMSETAFFIAAFESGAGVMADVSVPDIADYDRVALQWRGKGAFEIHAKEFGADYGEDGHVWFEAPRTASAALSGEGGFLMALGDGRVEDARFAQVYSYPRAHTAQSGAIVLSVEAEVTPANCETDVQAQTLQRAAGGADVQIMDMTLQVPGCDAIGDFMVLSNVLPELTL